MNIVNKTIFSNDIFENIEKKDSIIAVLFFLILFITTFALFYIVKVSPLFSLIKEETNMRYHLLYGLIMDLPGLLGVLLILKYRKQLISTIGIRKKGTKFSILIGSILLLSVSVHFVINNGSIEQLIYKTLFYIIFVGFYEELIFRGFLWPRLVVGLGKVLGTIISGIFFGAMHIPMDIVYNNKTFYDTVVLGNTSSIDIGGGVIVALIFIYIYTRNNNILLPSFVHGILDML
ncbi:CPBP family intramembrane metalloprotease [Clostridium chromiireducens]|uniref:CPBP family intramembrane metalloprotease n=3 Tax=Clostridium chromiireducens TaxID=225345 RepID=A0A399IP81_9CLOT|nr:CPBP family intramembrane glutamic endopeptidase [Clostridium chromiireducens]RII34099.1 CPBP family intramembrane metalloprotease [Clostridium chromiireducens]